MPVGSDRGWLLKKLADAKYLPFASHSTTYNTIRATTLSVYASRHVSDIILVTKMKTSTWNSDNLTGENTIVLRIREAATILWKFLVGFIFFVF